MSIISFDAPMGRNEPPPAMFPQQLLGKKAVSSPSIGSQITKEMARYKLDLFPSQSRKKKKGRNLYNRQFTRLRRDLRW